MTLDTKRIRKKAYKREYFERMITRKIIKKEFETILGYLKAKHKYYDMILNYLISQNQDFDIQNAIAEYFSKSDPDTKEGRMFRDIVYAQYFFKKLKKSMKQLEDVDDITKNFYPKQNYSNHKITIDMNVNPNKNLKSGQTILFFY